jgi:predicted transposase/invertase (TIGR01784 family)
LAAAPSGEASLQSKAAPLIFAVANARQPVDAMAMRYLDPKNDWVFKKVFGHANLLQSFLNALLPLSSPIESLEYLPAEMVPEIPVMKHSIVDVRCRDQNGRQFIVEMQMLWTDSFKSRVLFNASKAYVRQIDKTEDYESLEPVFSLNLVNQSFEKDTAEFYHHYAIVHLQDSGKRLKGLEFVFVELPKFRPEKILDQPMTDLWLRFLTEIESETEAVPGALLENPFTREAVEQVRESAFTKTELLAYDRYWDSIRMKACSTGRSLARWRPGMPWHWRCSPRACLQPTSPKSPASPPAKSRSSKHKVEWRRSAGHKEGGRPVRHASGRRMHGACSLRLLSPSAFAHETSTLLMRGTRDCAFTVLEIRSEPPHEKPASSQTSKPWLRATDFRHPVSISRAGKRGELAAMAGP